MEKKRVFVNGYGSIGSRIAAFLQDDSEVSLIGVGKHTPGPGTALAKSRGLRVFAPEERLGSFAGQADGSIESALDEADLVIDASPGGSGYDNKVSLYEPRGLAAIYQGGESASGERAVSQMIFNSRANYADAVGARHAMQGSCNVTGMGRILQPLREKYGMSVERYDVTLVRRWADLDSPDAEVPDTIEIAARPHHADDVKSFMGQDTPLFLRAVKVPTRQMHLHILDARFKSATPAAADVLAYLQKEPGVAVLWGAKGTKEVRDFAATLGFAFSDTNMVHIHAETVSSSYGTLQMMYSDDQTGIVIPENHMLMQAMLYERGRAEAAAHTEAVFHMAEKKAKLEAHFAA